MVGICAGQEAVAGACLGCQGLHLGAAGLPGDSGLMPGSINLAAFSFSAPAAQDLFMRNAVLPKAEAAHPSEQRRSWGGRCLHVAVLRRAR